MVILEFRRSSWNIGENLVIPERILSGNFGRNDGIWKQIFRFLKYWYFDGNFWISVGNSTISVSFLAFRYNFLQFMVELLGVFIHYQWKLLESERNFEMSIEILGFPYDVKGFSWTTLKFRVLVWVFKNFGENTIMSIECLRIWEES